MIRAASSELRHRRSSALAGLVVLLAALVIQVVDVNPAVSQSTTIVAARTERTVEVDPEDGVWGPLDVLEIPLTAQQTSYPFGGGSVESVQVAAVHDGETLFVRVQWDDRFASTRTDTADRFADAVAVQFPEQASASVPSVCMGQADGGVNIWQWRADSQVGFPQSAQDIHDGAVTDIVVPEDDELAYPARAVGNPMAQPGAVVQNLLAQGFGTIGPADEQAVEGHGVHDDGGWAVVFARPLDSPGHGQPGFAVGDEIDTAFAVWNGDRGDRNGQKSVSNFVRLALSDEPAPESRSTSPWFLLVGVAGIAGAVLLASRFPRPRVGAGERVGVNSPAGAP